MPLGLGAGLSKSGIVTPGIVTDNLVLKHKYDAGAVVPVSDGAAYFDGANDYILMADDNTLDMGTGSFTLTAWVKTESGRTSDKIINKWANDGTGGEPGGYFMFVANDGKLRFRVDDGGNTDNTNYVVFSGTSLINDGNWHFCTCVYETNTSMKIYVDGILEATDTTNPPSIGDIDNSLGLRIGLNEASGEDLKGYVCNVGIWTSVLTQAQIKSIMWKNYAGLTDSEKANLVSWWNLDSSESDVEGNGIVHDNHYGGSTELGSELLTNGSLDTGDISGWNAGSSGDGTTPYYDNGGIRIKSGASGGNSYIHQGVLTQGGIYEISYEIRENNGGTLSLEDDGTTTLASTVGVHTIRWYFNDSDSSMVIKRSAANTDILIDNISCKILQGNPGKLT